MTLYVDKKRETIQFDVTEPNENMIPIDLELSDAVEMHRDNVRTFISNILENEEKNN